MPLYILLISITFVSVNVKLKVCKDQLLNKSLILSIYMYLTALMQVTRLGCEIPRSKERPTNPLMNNFNTYFFTLNEGEITF